MPFQTYIKEITSAVKNSTGKEKSQQMGETIYDSDSSTASTVEEPTEEQVLALFCRRLLNLDRILTNSEQIAQSEELKSEANKAFQEDHFVKAIELYTRYVSTINQECIFVSE